MEYQLRRLWALPAGLPGESMLSGHSGRPFESDTGTRLEVLESHPNVKAAMDKETGE